jgi:hypothetical protein
VLKSSSPQSIDRVIELLRQHPEYERRWARPLSEVAPDDQQVCLFMLAARWADDVRNEEQFTHRKWHYIDQPFEPAGQPAWVSAVEPDAENIRTAYRLNLATLAGDASPAEKAVALCWVLHLTGDVHQPLHTITLFTAEFPRGDHGGNSFHVRAKETSSPIGLHVIWDDLVLGSSHFRTVHNKAIKLRNEFPADSLPGLEQSPSPAGFEAWLRESYEAGRDVAYRNGALLGSPRKDDAPVLPEGYLKAAKLLAEQRIVMAGYRLAGVLRTLMTPQ